jgi:hypothetical protein
MFSFFRSQSKLFKQLEFLGYDPVSIKEVLKTHKTFESALETLNSMGCKTIKKKLIDSGIPKEAANVLGDRFDSEDKAIHFYKDYQIRKPELIRNLMDMGFRQDYIDYCIQNFWDLNNAIEGIQKFRAERPIEENKREQRVEPELIIDREDPSRLRFSIHPGSNNSPLVFDIERGSIRGDFEEIYDEISTSMRRNSIRRRESRVVLPPPLPYLPQISSSNSEVQLRIPPPPPLVLNPPENNLENSNPEVIQIRQLNPMDLLFLNLQLLDSIAAGDDTTALLIIRILTELCPQPHMEEEEINAFDKFSYSSSLKLLNDNCTICYEDFVNGAEVIRLPCEHCFDKECIKTWLKNSVVCPLCKYNLKEYNR